MPNKIRRRQDEVSKGQQTNSLLANQTTCAFPCSLTRQRVHFATLTYTSLLANPTTYAFHTTGSAAEIGIAEWVDRASNSKRHGDLKRRPGRLTSVEPGDRAGFSGRAVGGGRSARPRGEPVQVRFTAEAVAHITTALEPRTSPPPWHREQLPSNHPTWPKPRDDTTKGLNRPITFHAPRVYLYNSLSS